MRADDPRPKSERRALRRMMPLPDPGRRVSHPAEDPICILSTVPFLSAAAPEVPKAGSIIAFTLRRFLLVGVDCADGGVIMFVAAAVMAKLCACVLCRMGDARI